jgi:hypothetical protein
MKMSDRTMGTTMAITFVIRFRFYYMNDIINSIMFNFDAFFQRLSILSSDLLNEIL